MEGSFKLSLSCDKIGESIPRSVLCYVRPWYSEQMRLLGSMAFPGSNVVSCSEHKSVDEVGLNVKYYAHLRGTLKQAGPLNPSVSTADAEDMILRCRLLRKLPRSEAERHVYAMANAVSEILANHKPEIVLSLTVDSYVIDLMLHFCTLMGIRFIGLVPSFVNGYFRVTARGERTINPQPDQSAVEAIRQKLVDPLYAPAFTAKAIAHPKLSVLKRWAGNAARVPYFWAMRFLTRDPYNYHYWGSQLVSTDRLAFLPPKDLGWKDWEQVFDSDQRPPLYIPLQMLPEATVDYWCEDVSVTDYYNMLERLIMKHHETFQLLIKEHPNVMGYRPSDFYRKLRTDSRITVVPTYTPSNYVLDRVPAVLVWTGTVGYEAALRGKAVITLCDPYYARGKRFLRITRETDSAVLLSHVLTSSSTAVTREEQEDLLQFLIMQLFKGSFKNDGSWSSLNPTDVRDTERMALSLRALASV